MSKTALFIDGPNLYVTAKVLNLNIDYKLLRSHFSAMYDGLVRAYYYTALYANPQDEYSSIQPLVDWLSYNGYSVVSKPVKEFVDPVTQIRKVKGNMDIEIAVDALDLSPTLEHAIFFTGDGDFKYLLQSLQRRGVQCTVVSSIRTSPSMCADELRRAADTFMELDDLRLHIERQERPETVPRRVSRFSGGTNG